MKKRSWSPQECTSPFIGPGPSGGYCMGIAHSLLFCLGYFSFQCRGLQWLRARCGLCLLSVGSVGPRPASWAKNQESAWIHTSPVAWALCKMPCLRCLSTQAGTWLSLILLDHPVLGQLTSKVPGSKLKGIQLPWVLMPNVMEISLPWVSSLVWGLTFSASSAGSQPPPFWPS